MNVTNFGWLARVKVLSEQTWEELKRAAGGRPYKADNTVTALMNYRGLERLLY